MLDIIISLEATCDLEKEQIEKYNLSVIDMEFEVDGQQFSAQKDGVVESKLYEKMLQKKKTGTSQINEYNYENYFKELLKQNKPILHIAFSSGLSGTGSVAKQVADKLNETSKNKIFVIDSLCACSGHGLLAVIARDYAEKCENVGELVAFVENIKHKLIHFFTVDSLTYLANGGRIDSKKAFFGNLLSIKPVMQMSKTGTLEVMFKVISRKKSISSIVDLVKKTYDENFSYCYISHANCLSDALLLKEKIESSTSLKPIITHLGPVIGCHSGPGTLAVFFISKEERK